MTPILIERMRIDDSFIEETELLFSNLCKPLPLMSDPFDIGNHSLQLASQPLNQNSFSNTMISNHLSLSFRTHIHQQLQLYPPPATLYPPSNIILCEK